MLIEGFANIKKYLKICAKIKSKTLKEQVMLKKKNDQKQGPNSRPYKFSF